MLKVRQLISISTSIYITFTHYYYRTLEFKSPQRRRKVPKDIRNILISPSKRIKMFRVVIINN